MRKLHLVLKMAVFGIKMAAVRRRTIQRISPERGRMPLAHIMSIPNYKKSYHAVFEISLYTDDDADDDDADDDDDDGRLATT